MENPLQLSGHYAKLTMTNQKTIIIKINEKTGFDCMIWKDMFENEVIQVSVIFPLPYSNRGSPF